MTPVSPKRPRSRRRVFLALVVISSSVSVGFAKTAPAQTSGVSPRFATLEEAVRAGALSNSVVAEVRSGQSPRVIAQLNSSEVSGALTAAALPETDLRDPAVPTVATIAADIPSTETPWQSPDAEIPVRRPGDPVVARRTAAPLSFDGAILRQQLDNQKAEIRQSVSGVLRSRQDFANLPAFAANVSSEVQLLELVNAPGVARIAANEVFTSSLTASLPSIGQPSAVSAGLTGAGTYVGIIDTGVDYTRSAFGSCASPGGACRVSHLPADFTRNADGSPFSDGMPDDTCATMHGTNVAGIVAGTAPGTKIVAADVFQPLPATATRPYSCTVQGAYTSDILSAINYMVNLKLSGVNLVAVNMSFGGVDRFTSPCADDTQIGYMRSVGIQPIAASGNAALVNGIYQDGVMNPACIPGVISVGANFNGGGPTSFSQSAPLSTMIFAPGNAISAAGLTKSGTSMAAPHIAAAFAMVSQARPAWSLDRRFQFLQDSSTPIANLYVSRTEKSLSMSAWSAMLTPPPNDNRASASPAPASMTLNGYLATVESGEASHGGISPTRTVWYRYTMTRPGRFNVESPNAIGLYSSAPSALTTTCTGTTYVNCRRITGNAGDLIEIAISAQSGTWQMAGTFAEQSILAAPTPTKLTINTQGLSGAPEVRVVDLLGNEATNPLTAKVIARNAPGGNVVGPFSASLVAVLVGDFPEAVMISPAPGQASDNDSSVSPLLIAGLSGSTDHTTVTATPTAGGSFDRDLWYQWVAPASGNVLVSTAESNIDTEICVTGPIGQDCSGATPNPRGTTSIVTVKANDVVSIRVGVPTNGVAQGTIHLTWRLVSDQRTAATAQGAVAAPTASRATAAAATPQTTPNARVAASRAPGAP
jgi:Subtilase family